MQTTMYSRAVRIRTQLEQVFGWDQAQVLADVIDEAYSDLVKTSDFNELKAIVKELAEAQTRTEKRVEELAEAQARTEKRVGELAEAQARTEKRLDELTAAQVNMENRLTRLEVTVQKLIEAQANSEERLTRLEVTVQKLVEAQANMEKRLTRLELTVQKLIEAQARTEKELHELVLAHKETRRQLGGLAETVGYGLENQAYKALPALLERDFGITVTGRLKRGWVPDNYGNMLEVNIIGEGVRDGKKVTLVGECKSQLSKRKVENFIRKRLDRLDEVFDDIFPLIVTHMTSEPDVEEYVRERGIALYYSYDF